MIRLTLALALTSLTGCLDSIVDNPCDDGYTLVDDTCVAEPDPEHAPPEVDENVDEPTPPQPPSDEQPPQPPSMQPPGAIEPVPPEPPPTEGLSPCPTCE